MFLQQILQHLRREWRWTIFYTLVMTMTAVGIAMLVISFGLILKTSAMSRSFIKDKVVLFQRKTIPLVSTGGRRPSTRSSLSSQADLKAYLQASFSTQGKAGSYCSIPAGESLPYDSIRILLGAYPSLLHLFYKGSMAVFVPPSHQEDVGKTIRLGNQDLVIQGAFPERFMVYDPSAFYEHDNNYLLLCTRDFTKVLQMFPKSVIDDPIISNLVLVNPSDEEIQDMQTRLYEAFGHLYLGVTAADFIHQNRLPDVRAIQLYFSYYILCFIILVLLAITNIIRMVEANITEYTIHYIYGASLSQLRWQVACFTLTLHILPMVGIGHLILINHLKGASFFPLALAFVLGLSYGMGRYAEKRVGNLRTIQNLRRDYE